MIIKENSTLKSLKTYLSVLLLVTAALFILIDLLSGLSSNYFYSHQEELRYTQYKEHPDGSTSENYHYADTPYTKASYIFYSYYLLIPFLLAIYFSFKFFKENISKQNLFKNFFHSLIIPLFLLTLTVFLQLKNYFEAELIGKGFAIYALEIYGLVLFILVLIINGVYYWYMTTRENKG